MSITSEEKFFEPDPSRGLNLDRPGGCRVMALQRKNGRTDKHDVYWTTTFNRSCNVWKVNPSEKKNSIRYQTYAKTEDHIELILFQFSASPAPILGTTENATFAHFMKKSMHLKTGFLSDYQVLFFLLNGPQPKQVYSLIDRFRSIYDVRR